jgi:beta-glucosidase
VDPEALAGLMGGTLPEEPQDSGAMSGMPPMDSDPKTMRDALQDGGVTASAVTAAARRVLHEMDRFGYLDGKQKHAVTPQDIEANAAVIRKTAEDSAVLLKNERSLPLTAADLRSLALIGPGAGQVAAIGSFGERSGGLTERQVSPLAALKKFAPEAHVAFAVDDDLTGEPVDAAMLSHQGAPGLARTDGMGVGSIDPELNFTLGNGKALPANTKVSWSGTLAVPTSGEYWIYLQSLGARALLSIDGKRAWRTGAMSGAVHGDVQQASQDGGFPTTDGLDNVRRSVALAKGPHTIEVQISGDTSNSPEQVRLSWLTPEQRLRDHRAAIDAAKNAHTAVVFLWTRGKPAFGLPGEQDRLVEEIAAVNPNTIVVLNVSQPIAMPWLNKVKAVLQMWWPGDEGGWATAGVLLGKVNPAGRLPFTWAKRLEDYPANDPAHPERSAKGVGGITTYSEGIEVGYRGFDRANVEPLFPFGHGLSYTSFEYSNLRVLPASDGGLDVSLRVRNTGKAAGDEVPQVYLEAPEKRPDGVQFAVRSLAGFERITLRPGELKAVSLHVTPRALDYWSVASNRWVRAGARRVSVGSSSRDLKLSAMVP